MYNKIELSNFRGFKEFSMDLKPVTLIAGKNNTGKTSILEAIFLYQDYATPDVFSKLLGFRGVQLFDMSARALWESLFYNADSENTIKIGVNSRFSLKLQKNKQYTLTNTIKNVSNGKPDLSSGNYALSCEYQGINGTFYGDYLLGNVSNDVLLKNLILSGRDNNIITPNEGYMQYLGPNVNQHDITIAEWFGKTELSKSKKKLIEILSIIDGDIVDVTTIATTSLAVLYFTKKDGTMLPMHSIGDGMRKLFQIALVMLANPGCILLLDEVENGLHYSLHEKFWESISTLAKQLGCQIIATTHSYECISGALAGVVNADVTNDFSYVRLDKDEAGITPKVFSNETLKRALDTDWEVR